MSSSNKTLSFQDCVPIADVLDNVILSRDGALTIGWELFPPQEYTMTASEFDTLSSMLTSSMRALPEWTLVHRQDIYSRKQYHSDLHENYLESSYTNYFEGRDYMSHRQFIWFSFNPSRLGKAGPLKSSFGGSASGIRYRSVRAEELAERLAHFENRCSEFVSLFSSACAYSSRRLTREDIEGVPGGTDGLLEEHRRWFAGEHDATDMTLEGGTYIDRDSRRMFSYSFDRTDDLPSEVSNYMREHSLSSPECDILCSSASPIGADLDFEHMLNFYYVFPSQSEVMHELDRRRKNMTAMSKGSAENTNNARAITEFIDMIHSSNTMAVYTHFNIIAWGEKRREMQMRGDIGAALSSMGMRGRLNTLDTLQLWIASLPGGAMEVGEDNYMLAELEQALCLGVSETFMKDFPEGMMRLCDRHRHIPVQVDFGRGAYEANLVENGNSVIIGPSGSGKSFFTNNYVRGCYYSGQHVFIIDKGDSYESLTRLINEESGGRDGVYYSWSAEHPYSFAPLLGCRDWDKDPENIGMSYFLSMLRIMWTPKGGWNEENSPILYRIVTLFIETLPGEIDVPTFDDFCNFVNGTITARIKAADVNPDCLDAFVVGSEKVSSSRFDIGGLSLALSPYARGGQFGFLLNSDSPVDLFKSRFVVFEVDALQTISESLYAVCTFNIIHAFQRKMRSRDEQAYRLLFIEEAWSAIATEGTADYLRSLWKTCRKYNTSATVVTQQVSDIIGSDVIKDAILSNSPIKILLSQKENAASFDQMAVMLGLSPREQAMVRSVGRGIQEGSPLREVFITLGGRRWGVYSIEVSPQEAMIYESNKKKKQPLLTLADEKGSIIEAVRELTCKHTY